jgi:hypothetical protein
MPPEPFALFIIIIIFALVIFQIASGLFLDHNPPSYTSCLVGMTGVYHIHLLLVEMESHKFFPLTSLQPQFS